MSIPDPPQPAEPGVLRPSASMYDEARCGLPGCGEPLFMTWCASKAIYLSDAAHELADPATAHTTTWQVECGAGHVVLVPPDTAADCFEFGSCGCAALGGYPQEESRCGHNDMERLRLVITPAPEGAPGA